MFGLFKTPSFADPALGEFRRKGGMWRGEIALGDIRAPLALPGSRAAPDPQALDIARSIATDYPGWRAGIAASLFEHYAPYAEGVGTADLEAPAEALTHISQPDQVWRHTSVEFVAVGTLDGELGVEIGYRVAWDEEHTLGARLRNGRLLELNGSVLPP
ncbi:MAG TPA: hypothetical protein PK440_15855 [Candidatus Accumulibacter phosphatis]|nr:hypothetical protein [Accumulibacter sp.]HRL77717.1 hypothetical protein [Candidatus Accumulibacter phosphatis]HRQ96453.1 hypothetical protein [Candidatus Accumulibacter phosphatis]